VFSVVHPHISRMTASCDLKGFGVFVGCIVDPVLLGVVVICGWLFVSLLLLLSVVVVVMEVKVCFMPPSAEDSFGSAFVSVFRCVLGLAVGGL
jgi:hypothetical protein